MQACGRRSTFFATAGEVVSQPSFTIDYAKAQIKNRDGLDEIRIAEIIGADGARPYLSPPSRYLTDFSPLDGDLRDGKIDPILKGAVGGWTWPVFCLNP